MNRTRSYVVLMSLFLPGFPTSAQELFTPLRRVPESVRAWNARAMATGAGLARSAFVRVDAGALVPPRNVRIRVFGEDLVGAVRERRRIGGYTIVRVLGDVDATFAVDADGSVAGHIEARNKTVTVGHTGVGDVHVAREIDPSALPPCATVDPRGPIDRRTVVSAQPSNYVDVAAFYTVAARKAAGGAKAIETEIALRVAMANQANAVTKVPWRFRLVYVAETPTYVASGRGDEIRHFRDTNDGHMDEVHKPREQWGADLMVLITNPTQSFICGISDVPSSLTQKFAHRAFSITWLRCLAGHTLTHEMGHNCGLHHRNPLGGLFPYSYGYTTTDRRFRSIMALGAGTRVNMWSTPDVKYQNSWTMGTRASQDSARSMKEVQAFVSSFLPTKTLEWCALDGGVAGTHGVPELEGSGTIEIASSLKVTLSNALDRAPGLLVIGGRAVNRPAFGGTLVPAPEIVLGLVGQKSGVPASVAFLRSLPKGTNVWLQAWLLDPRAQLGLAASDAIQVRVP